MTTFRGAKRVNALLAVGLMAGGLIGLVGVAPAGAAPNVAQVAALTTTTGCSRMSDATVRCSGLNNLGQSGDGTTNQSLSPVVVQAVGGGGTLSNVTQVVTGPSHACARISNGTAVCWGDNTNGQLGDGSSGGTSTTPVQVKNTAGSGALGGVVSLAAGFYHTCALLTNHTVDCWGDNGYYQLGTGGNAPSGLPVAVKGLTNVAGVTAGQYDTCTVQTDHTARCWGTNNFGQLGTANFNATPLPKPVRNGKNSANLTSVIQISAGPESTCAVLSSKTIKNEVRCWGDNHFGQLGTNNLTSTNKPVAVKATSGTGNLQNILQVSTSGGANGDHSCARTKSSTAVCWGSNNYGQMGNGTKGTLIKRPIVIRNGSGKATLTGITQILAGIISTCAVISGKSAQCWGFNSSGQFGNGGAHDALRPVAANP
jgi:alpha-tubulin suppressor-like RCC1 family protein